MWSGDLSNPMPLFQGITPLKAPQVALFKQCRARKLLITPPGMQHPSLIQGRLRIRDPPDHLQMVDFDDFSRKIPKYSWSWDRCPKSLIWILDSLLSIPKTPSLTRLRFQWPLVDNPGVEMMVGRSCPKPLMPLWLEHKNAVRAFLACYNNPKQLGLRLRSFDWYRIKPDALP